MCGYKGGLCIACGERVTHANFEAFHFDHKTMVNNAYNQADRWCGALRGWAPFTKQWFAWAATVDLICQPCHVKKHKPARSQLTLNLDAQTRLDNAAPFAGWNGTKQGRLL